MKPRRAYWQWFVLVGLVLAVYWPVLNAEFVNWDDPLHVYRNPRVTEPDALRRIWSDGSNPGPYPALYFTYRLEWIAADGKPWLFHLDNVVLHAANALLVGSLAGELGLVAPWPWLIAALWALHPVNVESVAWIAERKNVLYTFFWLASLLLYLRASRVPARTSWLAHSAALVLFVCALLSKAAAITLPAAIALVEWARRRSLRHFWHVLAPYVALAILAGIELVRAVPGYVEVPPLGTRLTIACRTFWTYLASFFWPRVLLPVYPKWSVEHVDPRDFLAAFGVIVLVAAAVAARTRLPRAILVGAGLFATNILLILGIVWHGYMHYTFTADRYLYLPAVGLAIIVVAGLDALARTVGVSARIPTIVLALWCGVLGVTTWRQVPVWQDSQSLWTHAIEHHPDCMPCQQNLALFLQARGDTDAAAKHYEAAMHLGPDAYGLLGFGKIRLGQNRLEEAAELFERARRLEPENPRPYYNLGAVLERQGKMEEAMGHYREAVRVDPMHANGRQNLGAALLRAGQVEEAKLQFEAILRLHPQNVEAELNLGLIASHAEDWETAERHNRAALAAASDRRLTLAAHRELAKALLNQDHLGEAIVHYQAVLRLAPDDVEVLGTLGWIRATAVNAAWRDGTEAIRLAEQARTLRGDPDADALDTLAAAYAEAGRFDDAVHTAQQALAIAEPDSGLAEGIRERLVLYAAKRPYRAP
jgi:tetratricopeptide (TPR) repeat protein